MAPTQGERLASLEQRLVDHEARCEERLGEIRASGAATLRAVEALKGRAWAVAVALLAWALVQVWSGSEARLDRMDAKSPSMAAPTQLTAG